jgi:hypothetical protein
MREERGRSERRRLPVTRLPSLGRRLFYRAKDGVEVLGETCFDFSGHKLVLVRVGPGAKPVSRSEFGVKYKRGMVFSLLIGRDKISR